MRTPWIVAAVISSCVMSVALADPTTRPVPEQALPDGPAIERTASEVIKLWPIDPPATQPGDKETITQRKNARGESDRIIRGVIVPTLTVFRPAAPAASRVAVVVCPGGGYGGQVVDREGFFIARRLNEAGITACVLKYRLPFGQAPAIGQQPPPVQDVQRAIRLVRAHAETWGIDKNRVGIMGFSAGGHLACTAATQFDRGDAEAGDPIERFSSRPDFAVLIYPVASMRDAFVHAGSRRALIGADADDALQHRYSTDEQITSDTPPLFVMHARDDKIVKVENSERIAAAAGKAGVPCELVIYEQGGHGFGLGTHAGEAGTWFGRFETWLSQSTLPAADAKQQ